jgi:fatty acid desaturase
LHRVHPASDRRRGQNAAVAFVDQCWIWFAATTFGQSVLVNVLSFWWCLRALLVLYVAQQTILTVKMVLPAS